MTDQLARVITLSCAAAVAAAIVAVMLTTQTDGEPKSGTKALFAVAIVATALASASGAYRVEAWKNEPRSESLLLQGCLSAGVLVGCLVMSLFWLTYIFSLAFGLGDHDEHPFDADSYVGLKVVIVAFVILLGGVVVGAPSAGLVWGYYFQPQGGSGHKAALAIGAGAVVVGFMVMGIVATTWVGSADPEYPPCPRTVTECPVY